ncbi:MAG: hypothetical protein OHK0022_55060 [Roseiflexaceae bacterium]
MEDSFDLSAHADEDFCYLTTTGRVTGRPHTIEIWFALSGHTIYMLAGGGDTADWVKNARREPRVTLRLAGREHSGTARVVVAPDEDALARRLVVDKYQPREQDDLSAWGRTALPVAVDLAP